MLKAVLALCIVITGVECNTDPPPIDDGGCGSMPCANGGTCQSMEGSFRCTCRVGYSGYTCDEKFSQSLCRSGWEEKYVLYGEKVCYKEYKQSVTWDKAWSICHDKHAFLNVYFNLTTCVECPVRFLEHFQPGTLLWTGGHIYDNAFRWDGYKQPTMGSIYDSNTWDQTAFSNVDNKCTSLRVEKSEPVPARRKRRTELFRYSLLTESCKNTEHPFACVRSWDLFGKVVLNKANEKLCPGYEVESEEMGLCYLHFSDAMNKTTADDYCRRKGGEIPKVHTTADLNILQTVRNKIRSFSNKEFFSLRDNWVQIESSVKDSCYATYVEGGYRQVSCGNLAQVLCQKKRTAPTVQFVKPNRDETIVADDIKREISCSLNEATEKATNVYWVKQNRVLSTAKSKDSQHFTMSVSTNLTQSGIDRNIFRSFADVPGYYWCEKTANANKPSENIRSNKIFVELPENYMIYIARLYLSSTQKYSFKDCHKNVVMGSIDSTRDENPYAMLYSFFRNNAVEYLMGQLREIAAGQLQVKLFDVDCNRRSIGTHVMMKVEDPTVNYNETIKIMFENRLKMFDNPIRLTPVVCQNTVKGYHGNTEYSVTFAGARIGVERNSTEICQSDGTPMAVATCKGDFYTGAYWSIVMSPTCNFTDLENSNSTLTLLALSQSPTHRKTVEGIANDTKLLTLVPETLTAKDVIYVADILTNIVNVGEITPSVAENAIGIVDAVLSTDADKIIEADKRGFAAQRILKAVDAIGVQTDLLMETKFRSTKSNIAVWIWEMSGNSDIVVGLMLTDETETKTTSTKPLTNDSLFILEDSPDLKRPVSDAAILLPAAFIRKQIQNVGSGSLRLSMHIFNNRKLFIPTVKRSEQDKSDDKVYTANSKVVAGTLSVNKRLLYSLGGDNVTTVFLPFQETNEITCGYWQHGATLQSLGMWKTDGCEYYEEVNGRHVCMCNHLTNFAILMDFEGQTPLPEGHKLALSIITIIGLSISIAALFLTILSFILFKKLREGRGQKTLFNLSLALICSWVIFLAGINQTQDYTGCIVVAVLIHYFLLVAFMWMCIEAVLQYLRFVQVLGTYIPKFMFKTAIPAWSIPLIPVIIVLAIDTDLYKGGNDYCWMSLTAFYYSFAIPVGVMILFNTVIYFIVIWNICRRPKGLQSTQSKSDLRMLNVRAALSVFILLGLTWVFGFLTISEARIVFSYIFAILNAFQGLFIFVLFTLRDKFFREQWTKLCCKSKPGEKRPVQYSKGLSDQTSNSTNQSTQGRGSISSSTTDVPITAVNVGFAE